MPSILKDLKTRASEDSLKMILTSIDQIEVALIEIFSRLIKDREGIKGKVTEGIFKRLEPDMVSPINQDLVLAVLLKESDLREIMATEVQTDTNLQEEFIK